MLKCEWHANPVSSSRGDVNPLIDGGRSIVLLNNDGLEAYELPPPATFFTNVLARPRRADRGDTEHFPLSLPEAVAQVEGRMNDFIEFVVHGTTCPLFQRFRVVGSAKRTRANCKTSEVCASNRWGRRAGDFGTIFA